MIVYLVSDIDGTWGHFRKRSDADKAFQECIDNIPEWGTNDSAEITLSRFTVRVDAETTFRLIEGAGGYAEDEVELKRWTPKS